jgi:hypothetical protein
LLYAALEPMLLNRTFGLYVSSKIRKVGYEKKQLFLAQGLTRLLPIPRTMLCPIRIEYVNCGACRLLILRYLEIGCSGSLETAFSLAFCSVLAAGAFTCTLPIRFCIARVRPVSIDLEVFAFKGHIVFSRT